jgi:uncharacterized membrane protein YkvA (DUF1232 family)
MESVQHAMKLLPDSMLVLVTCLAILGVCVLIFIVVFKIALKIKSTKAKFAAMGFSALYVVSPLDLIPDWVPILGQIDDAGALSALVGLAVSVYSDYRKKKKGNKGKAIEIEKI